MIAKNNEDQQKQNDKEFRSRRDSRRNSVESVGTINSKEKVNSDKDKGANVENDSDESSDDSDDQDEVVLKIDGIENNYKKAVKNLTEQIDTINKELTEMNKKIVNID